jgi:integrase
VRVERQRDQAGRIVAVKSTTSRRTVPVGQVVIDELAAHMALHPTVGPLFVDEVGAPPSYSRRKRLLATAAETAEVEGGPTAHSLRHFAASALIAGGASVKQVQAFLGHASAVITLGPTPTCGQATRTAPGACWTLL